MAHRQTPLNGLKGRMKRMEAKAFNVFMPKALHAAVKAKAQESAATSGGQINMNRVIVSELYEIIKDTLTDDERYECERFLAEL
jgi:hypothetical protein